MWSNPFMASTSVAGSGIVTHILKKCTEETKPLPAAASRAQQRAELDPDPAIVQQCVEMGFSEARVQEALRRVSLILLEVSARQLHRPNMQMQRAHVPASADACTFLTCDLTVLAGHWLAIGAACPQV